MDYDNECKQCGRPTHGKTLCERCCTDGKRHIIRKDGKRYYLFVSAASIMIFGPGENRLDEGRELSDTNLHCRLASKYLALGGNWEQVRKQFRSVDITGGNTFVKEILKHIECC